MYPESVNSFQSGNTMPEPYTKNRMKDWGAPGIAQIGEELFDMYRRNKWNKANPGVSAGTMISQTESDEMGPMLQGGGVNLPEEDDSGGMGKMIMRAFMGGF